MSYKISRYFKVSWAITKQILLELIILYQFVTAIPHGIDWGKVGPEGGMTISVQR